MKLISSGLAAQRSPRRPAEQSTVGGSVTDIEAAILSTARRRLLLTSDAAGQTSEVQSLVRRDYLSSVPNHDLGEHILVFELTDEGQAAREAHRNV